MDLFIVIRRWVLRQHVSIREIARRTNLSWNRIRKFLRSGEVEPKFKLLNHPSKRDAFADKLSSWVKLEASKSRKQKRTTKQLHTDLLAFSYDGCYGRVAAFVRDWKTARQQEQETGARGTFVPFVFHSGEAFQFD